MGNDEPAARSVPRGYSVEHRATTSLPAGTVKQMCPMIARRIQPVTTGSSMGSSAVRLGRGGMTA